MVREFQRHMFFLGQNAAFRYGVEGGVPIVVPGGESISTVAYEIAGAPEPESSTAIETDVPVEETQAPTVEPWPVTSSADQEDKPPPPPPVSLAPARSEMRTPPPPPPPNRPTNKMPNVERRTRWNREKMGEIIRDQIDLGGTQSLKVALVHVLLITRSRTLCEILEST